MPNENKPCCKKCVIELDYKPHQCNNGECPCHQEKTPPTSWEEDMRFVIESEENTDEIIKQIRSLVAQMIPLEEVMEIIKSWKNEGDNPTETDLVLENILSSLKQKLEERRK